MRVMTIIFAALMLSSCVLAQEISLRVMTFNVRFGLAQDGANAWPKRKDILVNCIKNAQPDVLGLQECLSFQADYIAANLKDYQWVGVGRDKDGSGEMTAVFYRKEVLIPLETRFFWLSETPDIPGSTSWDTSLTRMATRIRFYHPATGRNFLYVNTHLDHKGEQARQQGIQVINNQLGADEAKMPVILTGDFNAAAGKSQPYTTALEKGFKDSWIEAAEKKGPAITFGSFGPPQPNADSRIDWIMFKGNVQVKSCETDLYNEGGRYPTDHYPVRAELLLP